MPRIYKVTVGRNQNLNPTLPNVTVPDLARILDVASALLTTSGSSVQTRTDLHGLLDAATYQQVAGGGNSTRTLTDLIGLRDTLGTPFPTFASTGVPSGASLITVAGTTATDGTTYTAKHFTNGLDITGNSNVTFVNCKITGRLEFGYAGTNRTFTNCEVDGNAAGTSAAIGGQLRGLFQGCKVWNAAQGIQGGGGDGSVYGYFRDCFFGELYGTGDMHCEGVLLAEYNTEFDHCTILGNFRSGGNNVTTGGMSSALSMYNHGSFWGPKINNYVHNCLFQSIDANTTIYWGTEGSPDTIYPLTNCDLVNNTFRKVSGRSNSNGLGTGDIVHDYGGGSGNVISGNVYEDSGLAASGDGF